jgi:SAM-dependent methyltransferase
MIPAIIDFVRRNVKPFKSVLEVGSLNINGTIRDAIQSESYLGVDRQEGPCVDLVIDDVLDLTDSYDAVICCETLEHDINPWRTVEHLKSLLLPGGTLIISTPTFGFPLHRYPIDCYRFGMDAYTHFLFKDYEVIALDTLIDLYGFPVICGIGKKWLAHTT